MLGEGIWEHPNMWWSDVWLHGSPEGGCSEVEAVDLLVETGSEMRFTLVAAGGGCLLRKLGAATVASLRMHAASFAGVREQRALAKSKPIGRSASSSRNL